MTRRLEEKSVVTVSHLMDGHCERIHPNAVDGPLAFLPEVRTHQEFASGNNEAFGWCDTIPLPIARFLLANIQNAPVHAVSLIIRKGAFYTNRAGNGIGARWLVHAFDLTAKDQPE